MAATGRYDDVLDTNDPITDFVSGSDLVDLSTMKAGGNPEDFDPITKTQFLGTDHNLIYYYEGNSPIILSYTNGDFTTAEFKLVLDGRVNVTVNDFIL